MNLPLEKDSAIPWEYTKPHDKGLV